MNGSARSLKYTSVDAYSQIDKKEIDELGRLGTRDLKPPVTAFFTNLFRLSRLQQLPVDLSALTTVWGETVHAGAIASVMEQQGVSPCQEVRVYLCSRPKLRCREAGWGASGGERSVRNVSELDSARCRGEPARNWRSLKCLLVT